MAGEKLETIAKHETAIDGKWWLPFNNEIFDYAYLTSKRCPDFYMDFMRCTSRVGLQNSATRCKEQFEDLQECRFNTKRNLRLSFIKAERIRQGRPPIEPMPAYAQKSSDYDDNTENMAHGPR